MDKSHKILPIILAGGQGRRLQGISTPQCPKPFIKRPSTGWSFFQDTVNRVSEADGFLPPVILCQARHQNLVAAHMAEINAAPGAVILEPSIRNTAPAIVSAALYAQENHPDAMLLILPSDHVFDGDEAFLAAVDNAFSVAKAGHLVTFGITPDAPDTGYGYIRKGEKIANGGFVVGDFTEKPDQETAESFIESGEYLWNSGMFLFPAELLLREMKVFQPAMVDACDRALAVVDKSGKDIYLDEAEFTKCEAISIDYALMEHTKYAACIPLSCGWSDIGTPESFRKVS